MCLSCSWIAANHFMGLIQCNLGFAVLWDWPKWYIFLTEVGRQSRIKVKNRNSAPARPAWRNELHCSEGLVSSWERGRLRQKHTTGEERSRGFALLALCDVLCFVFPIAEGPVWSRWGLVALGGGPGEAGSRSAGTSCSQVPPLTPTWQLTKALLRAARAEEHDSSLSRPGNL